jgi:hypothetical protein
MAATLPAALALYEIVFHRPLKWRQFTPIIVAGILDAAYVAGKLLTHNPITISGDYRQQFTLHRVMENARAYLNLLFFTEHGFNSAGAAAFCLGLVIIAILLRSRPLIFASLLTFTAMLPIMFVVPREGFVLYVPLVGLTLYVAELLAAARLPRPALVAIALILMSVQYHVRAKNTGFIANAQAATWSTLQQFRAIDPSLPPNTRLLFIDNPFGDYWDVYFLAKLWFHDPSLRVALIETGQTTPRGDEHDSFDRVFRWVNGRMIRQK